MSGYLELVAWPTSANQFEVGLFIVNIETETLTANWKIELPAGIEESRGRHILLGRTAAPSLRKIEANRWEIAVKSSDAYIHEEIVVSATLSLPACRFTDHLRATIAQIRVE